jgi:diacylglycerol kinase (ATP)
MPPEKRPRPVGDNGRMSHRDALPEFVNDQKGRTGFARMWHAAGYSLAGLRAAWSEAAFRLEACLAFVMLPLSFYIAGGWVEVALLAGSVLLVLVVELLNTAIEAAIDRIGPERHPLSKRAKDMGSAAVLLAVLLAGGIWLTALVRFFSA